MLVNFHCSPIRSSFLLLSNVLIYYEKVVHLTSVLGQKGAEDCGLSITGAASASQIVTTNMAREKLEQWPLFLPH